MSDPATLEPGAPRHFFWLDWLRFIAAFMVVAIHARGGTWVEWGRLAEGSQTKLVAVFFALTRAGTEWVLVFFVLSGFLVGGKVIERVTDGCFRLREYAIDRGSRIWAPLAPALVWSALVAHWVGKPVSWADFGGNLLGLQGVFFRCFAGNIPLWSLAYEIWFYILGGAAAVWARPGRRSRLVPTLALAVVLAVFTRLQAEFLFAWLLGAMTYWLCGRPRRGWLAMLGVGLVAAGCVSLQLRSATISVDTSRWGRFAPPAAVATLLLALGIALLLPWLARMAPRSGWGKALHDWGGRWAAFSYTLYLTHYPALYVWEHYLPERRGGVSFGSIALYLLRIASCVLFAWLCYLPFERQTGRMRKFLRGASGAGGLARG